MHDNVYFYNKKVSSKDEKVNSTNEKKFMFSFFLLIQFLSIRVFYLNIMLISM
jgi:hypothetical protein